MFYRVIAIVTILLATLTASSAYAGEVGGRMLSSPSRRLR